MSTCRRLKLGGFSFAAAVDEAIAAGSKTEGAKHDDDTRVEPAASDEGTRQASTITDLIAAGEVLWTLLTGRAIPEDNRCVHRRSQQDICTTSRCSIWSAKQA